jgi:hypothetical protein
MVHITNLTPPIYFKKKTKPNDKTNRAKQEEKEKKGEKDRKKR